MPAAVIFDMDGVLLDSEPVHYVVLRGVLAAWGLPWSAEDHARTLGMTLEDTWDALCSRHALAAPRGDFEARYGGEIVARYRAGIAPIPGARELVGRLADAGVPIAVASSSPRSWVEAGLEGAGLRERFRTSVAGDEVAAGKPDPEIYLEAARGLGVDPAACIAIEDAPAGVQSARAAGMRVVLLRGEPGGDALATPDWLIDDLAQFDLAWLRGAAP